ARVVARRLNPCASARRAEIEDGGGMAMRARVPRIREQRLGEPRLAHAGIGAQQHDSAFLLTRRTRQQGGKALALGVAADERLRLGHTRMNAGELPGTDATRQAL